MPEISVEIEVFCARCGAGLCNQTSTKKHIDREAFDVEPCEKCLQEYFDDGYRKRDNEVE